MTISDFTIRFFKNGQEVGEANGGDIIDVEIEGTFEVTQIQEKEIYNFNLNMADIDFQNATYVDGSLTNALGTTVPDSGLGTFLAPYDNVGGRRSLTHKIKFKIKLAKANNFTERSARLNVSGGNGFLFNNDASKEADTNKFFYINIKPKINKWAAGGAALLAIATASSNQENNN